METLWDLDYMLQEIERWGSNARKKDLTKTDAIIAKDRYMRNLSEMANILLCSGIPAVDILRAAPFSRESVAALFEETA